MAGVALVGLSVIESSPAGAAVVKSDTIIVGPTRRLYVGGTGDVAVVYWGDNTNTPVTYKSVPTGFYLHCNVAKVMSTGTTATNILAEFA